MAENKITQREINNIVWKACDTLRPVMGSEQYKDYILTLLFIKNKTFINTILTRPDFSNCIHITQWNSNSAAT